MNGVAESMYVCDISDNTKLFHVLGNVAIPKTLSSARYYGNYDRRTLSIQP